MSRQEEVICSIRLEIAIFRSFDAENMKYENKKMMIVLAVIGDIFRANETYERKVFFFWLHNITDRS